MDLIMYDAQRQGRLSFYMVCTYPFPDRMEACCTLKRNRSQREKKALQLARLQPSHRRMLSFASTERLEYSNNAALLSQNL